MLTPKEILQIDATVLAGLFILLALIASSEDISIDVRSELLSNKLNEFMKDI